MTKKRTAKEKEEFLANLRAGMGITLAFEQSSQGSNWWYKWRRSDPVFDKEWDDAVKEGAKVKLSILEKEADRRATEGYDVTTKEVVKSQDGKTVGKQMVRTVRQYSDTLLIFRTKAEARRAGVQSYDERAHNVNTNINKSVDDMDEEELETLLGKLSK